MRSLGVLALAAGLAVTGTATAAGPPLPSQQSGTQGAVAPGGAERLVTSPAGRATLVRAVRRADGRTLRSRVIAGRWSVPAVTIDGATTGLSADGSTLVLARQTEQYPPRSTPLAILEVRSLTVVRRIVLPGFATVDAISPDGSRAYLIQYASEDPFDYRVRALDTATGRLDPRDIVDPREPDERMAGLPMSRVLSPDGRWAYTLYGGGAETFIHALDTVGRTARCIDLEMLPTQSDLSGVRMMLEGGRLLVRDAGETIARVDLRTFKVDEGREPVAAAASPAPPRRDDDDGGGLPWTAFVLGAVGACACGAAVLAVSRRPRRA